MRIVNVAVVLMALVLGACDSGPNKVSDKQKHYDSMPVEWQRVYQDLKPLSTNGRYDYLTDRIVRDGEKLGRLTDEQMKMILETLATKHQGKATAALRPFTR